MFLADLIIKAEKAIGEIQSQNRRRTKVAKREKYKELIVLMRQIEVYKNEKGYQNKESEINEIKASIKKKEIEWKTNRIENFMLP